MTRKHDRHVSDGTVHKLLPHHHEVRHSMLYYTINTYLVYTFHLTYSRWASFHPAFRLWSLRIFPSVPGKGKALPTIGWHTSREGVCVVDVGLL